MKNVLVHEYRIPFKGVTPKIIYHFSDSHLTEYDGFSDLAETRKAKDMTAAWEEVRKSFCVSHKKP